VLNLSRICKKKRRVAVINKKGAAFVNKKRRCVCKQQQKAFARVVYIMTSYDILTGLSLLKVSKLSLERPVQLANTIHHMTTNRYCVNIGQGNITQHSNNKHMTTDIALVLDKKHYVVNINQ
jgi:hypothetical protein